MDIEPQRHPGQLRGLLAEDAARVAAYAELNGSIWHQITVYEATVAAVPILSAVGCEARLLHARSALVEQLIVTRRAKR